MDTNMYVDPWFYTITIYGLPATYHQLPSSWSPPLLLPKKTLPRLSTNQGSPKPTRHPWSFVAVPEAVADAAHVEMSGVGPDNFSAVHGVFDFEKNTAPPKTHIFQLEPPENLWLGLMFLLFQEWIRLHVSFRECLSFYRFQRRLEIQWNALKKTVEHTEWYNKYDRIKATHIFFGIHKASNTPTEVFVH